MIVYVTRNQGGRTKYHTSECANYPENPQEWTQEQAEAWGMSECDECAGVQYRNPDGCAAPSNE